MPLETLNRHLDDLVTNVRELKGEVHDLNDQVKNEKKARRRSNFILSAAIVVASFLGIWNWALTNQIHDQSRDADIQSCERGNDLRQGIREFVFALIGPEPAPLPDDATPEQVLARQAQDERRQEISTLAVQFFQEVDCEVAVSGE